MAGGLENFVERLILAGGHLTLQNVLKSADSLFLSLVIVFLININVSGFSFEVAISHDVLLVISWIFVFFVKIFCLWKKNLNINNDLGRS